MSYCGQNIFVSLSVRIKRNHTTFVRPGQLFFGLLFLIAFALKVEGQTGTISVNTTSVCQGATEPVITFTGSGGTPEYTFNYIVDNGVTQSTLTTSTSISGIINIPVPTGSAGIYVYTLQSVTDNNNNTVNIAGQSVTVVVNPLPTPTITASGLTTFNCPGGRVTLSSSDPPPGDSYIYQWVRVSDLGTDITDIVDSTNSSIVATGGYRYAVRVTDNNGCVAVSDTIRVLQKPPPQPLNGFHNTTAVTACINYNPDSIFSPLPFGGISPYTYHWKENGIDVGTNSPSYDPDNLTIAGIYVYNCEVTDACGSTLTTVTQTITIIDQVSATISGGGNYCEADNIDLAVTLSNTNGTYSYQWQSGTSVNGPWTNIAGETNSTYSPSLTAGIYYYQIVVHANEATCNDETESVTVTVNALPTVAITGAGPVCPGSTNIYSGPAIAGYTYNWTISGTGTISGSATGQTVTVIANNNCGTYTLTLVTTLNGCAGAPCNVTVNVVDTEPPAWTTAAGSLDRSVACGNATALANAQALSPAATDNCGNIIYNKIAGILTGGNCGGTYTNTWRATDACSNLSTIFTQVITITDIQAPSLTGTLPGGAQGNICLAAAPAAPTNATIASLYTDNCGTVTATLSNTISTGNSCAWTVTYSYTVTDGCNPIAADVVYTGGDTQVPIITTCPVAQTFCVVATDSYTIPPLIATDNCSSILNITFQVTGATIRNGAGNDASGIFNPGVSTITWTVTDACGNTSTCTTLVTVSPKPTPIIYHN